MAAVVQIGKERWLAGMTWLAYEGAPSRADLRDDAETQRADWVAIRNANDFKQAGFCAAIDGEKARNLHSLAAKLAESAQQPWLGVFRISDELSWYIAVRDNHTILPDGDVLGNAEVIRAAQERHAGFLDWNHVSGDLADLESMIGSVTAKSSPIKSLTRNSTVALAAMAAVLAVGVIAGGGWWWMNEQAEARAREVAMANERLRLTQLSAAPKAVVATAPMPRLPSPDTWLTACASVLLDLPLFELGWALAKASCGQNSADISWRRQLGATLDNRPEGAVSSDGDSIEQTIVLATLDATVTADLLDRREATQRLRTWAQVANFALTLTPPAPQAPATQGTDKTAQLPPLSESPFSLQLAISPFAPDIAQGLGDLPGLRLSKLTLTEAGWTLQGVLYAR